MICIQDSFCKIVSFIGCLSIFCLCLFEFTQNKAILIYKPYQIEESLGNLFIKRLHLFLKREGDDLNLPNDRGFSDPSLPLFTLAIRNQLFFQHYN